MDIPSFAGVKMTHRPADSPVAIVLGVLVVLIFLLYQANVITALPCSASAPHALGRHVVHINIVHLLSNLYALYALSSVEVTVGSLRFVGILFGIVVISTTLEWLLSKYYKGWTCAIGLSGVLFGLFAWELIRQHKFDVKVLAAIVMGVVTGSMGPRSSFLGHAIGAVSGVMVAYGGKLISTDRQ